jgi:hypothetical protein
LLDTELPKLVPNPVDMAKAKRQTNEPGSFFLRVFGDCGNKKFVASTPVKLVPTVLVQATLRADPIAATNPFITTVRIAGGTSFLLDTGSFNTQPWDDCRLFERSGRAEGGR